MKTFICLFFCLLTQFSHAQTESAKPNPWRVNVEMGIQAGRVRPDQVAYYPYYVYGYTTYPGYPYYPGRAAGNRIGLTIHSFVGYVWHPQLITGLAFGVDYYNNSAFLPIAAAIQGDFSKRKKRITPFYTLEGGYAIAGPNPHDNELKGGWLWSPGAGLRINKGNGTGFLISAGYKHQQARQVASVDGVQVLSQVEYRSYNRLYFRMGFSF